MSKYDINSNPVLVRHMIETEKKATEKYYKEHPDALTLKFEKELRELGYEFEVLSQVKGFMPKHKEVILPIAVKYYQEAKENDKDFFLSLLRFKGFDEVVPMLLDDFFNPTTTHLTREFIGEAMWKIRSKKYINKYIEILLNPEYESNYLFIVHLVSGLKVEAAVPIFIKMLDNDSISILGIIALSKYKREEFRSCFERFVNDKNSYLRKCAIAALKRIDSVGDRRRIE